MLTLIVQAWVKDSPNVVPIGTFETRSETLAMNIAKAMRKEGFRVERFTREDYPYGGHMTMPRKAK